MEEQENQAKALLVQKEARALHTLHAKALFFLQNETV
jgi:hypothetical protein